MSYILRPLLSEIVSACTRKTGCGTGSMKPLFLSTSCSRHVSSTKPYDNNLEVSPEFVNRNPCNLEHMLHGYKPGGYELESPSRNFWYKIEYEASGQFIEARVVHHSGRTVVSASTKERAIQNQLYSANDFSAAKNLGRILAVRCQECGISFVSHEETKEDENKITKQAFLENFKAEGMQLTELQPYRMYGVNEAY